jgi:lipoprotein-releasing system permease protein
MFEFSIAFKYLIPRKKHLSVTLIALMSTGVISLIVWLLLVFLSITNGIESNWLKKLTALNAPVKVTPTEDYYSSYYYKVDSISNASDFSLKTLGEKIESNLSDPYDPEEDPEIPSHWKRPALDANGSLVDPVKGLTSILTSMKAKHPNLFYQDYEMSGALLKLQLLRNHSSSPFSSGQESMNFLTQVSYLATPPAEAKTLSSLLVPFTAKDLNHLLFLANYRMERTLEDGAPTLTPSTEAFQSRITQILPFLEIHTLKTVLPDWKFPSVMLPENKIFFVQGKLINGRWNLTLPTTIKKSKDRAKDASIFRKGNQIFLSINQSSYTLDLDTSFTLEEPLIFNSTLYKESIEKASYMQEIQVMVEGSLQGHSLKGTLPWKNLVIDTFTPLCHDIGGRSPPWVYNNKSSSEWTLPVGSQGESGILIPKAFQDSGVLLGDKGFLSYQGATSSSVQEQRVAVFVAGFYDPGIISIGNKCLLVPKTITKTINSSNTPFTFDKISLGGFQVWLDSPRNAEQVKENLNKALEKEGLLPYWKVSSYKDYDFAKDLLEQFKSDKLLLSLVGIIILIVACCNIISFLILLVSDKKKEIAILQAMGASTKSIALIFGICGVMVGLIGCAIGTLCALLTLHNIDTLSAILSALQGHNAFNPVFYGTLPNKLSSDAILFIFIVTPILSLLSGLIPALKACKLCPSTILRSES